MEQFNVALAVALLAKSALVNVLLMQLDYVDFVLGSLSGGSEEPGEQRQGVRIGQKHSH